MPKPSTHRLTLTPGQDTYTFCTGSLGLVTNRGKSTRQVFARLLRDRLVYYKANPMPPPLASIDMQHATVDKVHDIDRRTFSLTVGRARYVFRAKAAHERDRWVNGLRNQQQLLDMPGARTATARLFSPNHAVFQGTLEYQEKQQVVIYEAPRGVVNLYKTNPFAQLTKTTPLGSLQLGPDTKLAWESAAEFKAASGSFLFSVSPASGQGANARTVFVAENAAIREKWMSALACVIHATRANADLHESHTETFGAQVVSSIATLSRPKPPPRPSKVQSGGFIAVTAGNTRKRVSFLQRALGRGGLGTHLAPPATRAQRAASKQQQKQQKASTKQDVASRHDLRAREIVKHLPVPEWIPDSTVTECIQCSARLGAGQRHHCRLCGFMFCGRCTHKFVVPDRFRKKRKTGPVHVCFGCDYRSQGDQPLGETKISDVAFPPDHPTKIIHLSQWENPALYTGCHECGRGGKGQNCRACGKLFCGSCTSKLNVPPDFRAYNKPGGVPVCDRCRYGVKGGAHFVAQYKDKASMPLLRIRAPSLKEEESLSSRADSRFFSKLHGDNCAGCQAGFGLFNRRHKCFHCGGARYWCKRCLQNHIDLLPRDVIENASLVGSGIEGDGETRSNSAVSATVPMKMSHSFSTMGSVVPMSATSTMMADAGSQFSTAVEGVSGTVERHTGVAGTSAGTVAAAVESQKVSVDAEEMDEEERARTTLPPLSSEEEFKKRFDMQARLGEGSYGAVFKAVDRTDKSIVAVKVLDLKSGEKNTTAALAKEIHFMTGCNSPHVVAFKGAYVLGEKVGIVMEYCAAGSLSDMMEICDVTMVESQLAVVMRETLRGLMYLHESGRVHRDIKSGNILLTAKGECKLADFGVSAPLKKDGRRYTMIGTPYWMAPEVLRPTTTVEGYTEKVDIWAVGITAFELAKGVPPLSDIHPMRAILKIPYQDAPVLPDPENFSKEFIEFLALCLDKDATTRPTARQLLDTAFIKKAGSRDLILSLVEECIDLIESFREDEAAMVEEARMTLVSTTGSTRSAILTASSLASLGVGTGYISSSLSEVAPPPPRDGVRDVPPSKLPEKKKKKKTKTKRATGTKSTLLDAKRERNAAKLRAGTSLSSVASTVQTRRAATESFAKTAASSLFELSTAAYPSGRMFEPTPQDSADVMVRVSIMTRTSVVSQARSRRATYDAERADSLSVMPNGIGAAAAAIGAGDFKGTRQLALGGSPVVEDPELTDLRTEMDEICAHLGVEDSVKRVLMRPDLKLASLPKGLSLSDLNQLLPLLMRLQGVYRRINGKE